MSDTMKNWLIRLVGLENVIPAGQSPYPQVSPGGSLAPCNPTPIDDDPSALAEAVGRLDSELSSIQIRAPRQAELVAAVREKRASSHGN